MTRLAALIDERNSRLGPGEPALTQRRLAEMVGLNEATVSRHVNGVTTIDLPQAIAYARALGCSVESLSDDQAVGDA
jgi:plasmid maintenance system antidote protein VapI